MNTQQNNLNQIVNSVSLLEKDSYSIICCPEFKFKFIGEGFCNGLGVDKTDFLEKSLGQIDSPLSHLNSHYRHISEKVITDSNNKAKEYMTIIPSAQDMAVFHSKVSPIILEQEKIGLYVKTNKVNAIGILPLLKRLNTLTNNQAKLMIINKELDSVQLTEREEFILFMIALGKYDKEIAYFLQLISGVELTRDAITKIVVRNLYQKFDAVTRSELIIRAHSEGFLECFPKLLTPENSLKLAKFL